MNIIICYITNIQSLMRTQLNILGPNWLLNILLFAAKNRDEIFTFIRIRNTKILYSKTGFISELKYAGIDSFN